MRPRRSARAHSVEPRLHLRQDRDGAQWTAHALDFGRLGPFAALKIDSIERVAGHQPADLAALRVGQDVEGDDVGGVYARLGQRILLSSGPEGDFRESPSRAALSRQRVQAALVRLAP